MGGSGSYARLIFSGVVTYLFTYWAGVSVQCKALMLNVLAWNHSAKQKQKQRCLLLLSCLIQKAAVSAHMCQTCMPP